MPSRLVVFLAFLKFIVSQKVIYIYSRAVTSTSLVPMVSPDMPLMLNSVDPTPYYSSYASADRVAGALQPALQLSLPGQG